MTRILMWLNLKIKTKRPSSPNWRPSAGQCRPIASRSGLAHLLVRRHPPRSRPARTRSRWRWQPKPALTLTKQPPAHSRHQRYHHRRLLPLILRLALATRQFRTAPRMAYPGSKPAVRVRGFLHRLAEAIRRFLTAAHMSYLHSGPAACAGAAGSPTDGESAPKAGLRSTDWLRSRPPYRRHSTASCRPRSGGPLPTVFPRAAALASACSST